MQDILKAHHTESINIGIVGPRTYCIGGHDISNPTRVNIRSQISNILQQLKHNFDYVMGFTGLIMGSDQDFALACLQENIPYTTVLPYTYKENINTELYNQLLEQSNNIINLGKGNYAPKKVINKHKFIINQCDTIIFIESLYFIPDNLIQLSLDKNKGIIHIKL